MLLSNLKAIIGKHNKHITSKKFLYSSNTQNVYNLSPKNKHSTKALRQKRKAACTNIWGGKRNSDGWAHTIKATK